MSKEKVTKPVNRCHNPAGCDNECDPGMNFCNPCRKFFGMTGGKSTTKRVGGYRHPIIGIGEAGQTHLKQHSDNMSSAVRRTLNDLTSMDKDDLRTEIESRKKGNIARIILETGALQQQEEKKVMNEVTATDKQTTSQKKSASLKKMYADKPRRGVFFDGFLLDGILAESEVKGIPLAQFVRSRMMESIPAEVIKAGLLAEMRGKDKKP